MMSEAAKVSSSSVVYLDKQTTAEEERAAERRAERAQMKQALETEFADIETAFNDCMGFEDEDRLTARLAFGVAVALGVLIVQAIMWVTWVDMAQSSIDG